MNHNKIICHPIGLYSDIIKKTIARPSAFSAVAQSPSTSQNDQINQIISSASYSDRFNIAVKFNNWAKAFSELQKAFELKIVETPESIKHDLRTDILDHQVINQQVQFNPPSP